MAMNVQKQIAKKFVEYWTFQRGSEKGEDQQFWNSLLGEVLGLEDVKSHVQYQVPVPMKGTTKFLDAWIPETRVLIEHKSRGVNLDAPQAGHGGLTPYEQAVEYDNARPFDEKARWIVTCNFDEFRIYDRSKPLAPPFTLKLGNLPKEAYRLAFLVNPKEKAIDRELEISVQAGRIVGEIYDALLQQYNEGSLLSLRGDSETRSSGENSKISPSLQNAKTPSSESNYLAALNRLCVRLVFCLYAEDAGIFPKDCFRRLMENTPAPFLRERLKKLFEILDTPLNKRDVYLEPELCAFPYTNGGLFSTMSKQTDLLTPNGVRDSENVSGVSREQIRLLNNLDDIPPLTEEIRQLLIGASQFDWRDITPTIFGALFESTLNPVTRRAGGMVYTSVENIHKVIDPLFLSDLTRRVNEVLGMRTEDERQKTKDLGQRTVGQSSVVSPLSSVLRKKLLALQDEMAALTFLDPACGSGNFLTETYICLRRLENKIIAALQQGQGELDLGSSVKVSIAQFHGIEINDFAVAVAKTALWIAEAQMLQETAQILHREPNFLPLKDYNGIVEGNALRMDWGKIGLPKPNIVVVTVPDNILFKDAKAHLTDLKDRKVEVLNADGERFRFTKQIFKALSDKARDQSIARSVHWAAVAAVERLCAASTFLWDEKPRNGSVDILRYVKHGVCFSFSGVPYVAKITSKVYPHDDANVTYSVEAVSIEKNDARGITDSISKRQSLDPSAANRILNFVTAVKGATARNHFSYIIGNPPFSGARWMGKEQKADVLDIFGKDWQGVGDLDYVCCWYKKAMDCVTAGTWYSPYQADDGAVAPRPPQTKVAFVSTNSICQGGAVANLWKPLFAQGLEIDFAHRTFRWDNEAFDKAHVHCVIVGFHVGGNGGRGATALPGDGRAGSPLPASKTIFDGGHAIPAMHINGYLMDAPDVWIEKRSKPICDVPEIFLGGQPIDDGNLILTEEEKDDLLARHPSVVPLLRPFMMGKDFINRKPRWCLWMKDADISLVRSCSDVMDRIRKVREFRLASKRKSTLRAATTPAIFGAPVELTGHYIALPKVSSENRRYIPIDYLPPKIIPGDKLFVMPDATLYHFGILTSIVHMLWNSVVGGRLKSDYSYSNTIVYNNFPWPDLCDSASLRETITSTARAILDARVKYPNATLADLYDPDTMYLAPDLRAAHEANDRAVLAAYGLAPDTPEPEIVAHLFGLYAEMI